MTGGAFIPAQPAGQPVAGGIQLGSQQGNGQPGNVTPAGAPNAQQQLNALLATPGQAQPTMIPAGNAPGAPAAPSNNPPLRRRVVLPNTP